ncbi:MAG: L-arabinose isomerase, partial [Saprospiraceae bacterium]|nr:L-arabinose isomerase [Saprospiraceae bacterium]
MIDLNTYEIWFVVGSQHLYGDEVIAQVNHNAKRIAEFLDKQELIPVKIVYKPVLTTSESISACLQAANNKAECIGCIMWMHTFSPSKMWINGLKNFSKPLLHLHTQFHPDIPWSEIDMAYMNLHQAAHGDREFSHLLTRMNISRK